MGRFVGRPGAGMAEVLSRVGVREILVGDGSAALGSLAGPSFIPELLPWKPVGVYRSNGLLKAYRTSAEIEHVAAYEAQVNVSCLHDCQVQSRHALVWAGHESIYPRNPLSYRECLAVFQECLV